MNELPSIHDVHPFLSQPSPDWVQQDSIWALLEDACESFTEDVERVAPSCVDSITLDSSSSLPVATLSIPSDTIGPENPLWDIITSSGGEVHLPRYSSDRPSSGLEFDVIVPPEFRVGMVGQIRNSGGESQSRNISLNHSLRRCGLTEDSTVRIAAREGEIRIWPAATEQTAPAFRATPLGGVKLPSAETVEQYQAAFAEIPTIDTSRPTHSTLTLHVQAENNAKTNRLLSQMQLPIRKVATTYRGLDVTIEVPPQFTIQPDGRGALLNTIRKMNDKNYALTLTKALETAGFDETGEHRQRVAVLVRPGELRVVEAANSGLVSDSN